MQQSDLGEGSRASGNFAGSESTHTNTRISAGRSASVDAKDDITLHGASITAGRVEVHTPGDLNITSPQDRATYEARQRSAGVSLSATVIGTGGAGASISAARTNISSTYASVGEQSGVRAGDEGFGVNVGGRTDLTGGAITSTQKAVDEGKNTFSSAGGVSTTDVRNSATYSASSAGATLGVGSQLGQSGAGIGNSSGNASSVTKAAVSGIAGDTAARTGDAQSGIKPIFNADAVRRDVEAQVVITGTFGQQAIPLAASFADRKATELRKKGKEEEAKAWDEGGAYRIGMYGVLGLLTAGAGGAAGGVSSAVIAPALGEQIATLNLSEPVRQGLTELMGTTVGAVTGGAAGAAAALPQTALNYVSHSPFANVRRAVSQENARLTNLCADRCTLDDMRRIDAQMVALERAGNLAQISKTTSLTTDQALQLGELVAALHPLYGTPIALYQAISGEGIATQAQLSTVERFFNGVAAAVPLTSAAYKLVTSAATDMARMSASVGAIHHFKSAEELNAVMTNFNKAPAWKEGTQVAEVTLKPGTRVQMVVDRAAIDKIRDNEMNYVGNWASFDAIPDQAFARNNLAITTEFKKDVGYVVELEVFKPLNAQVGYVGSQGSATGGANQINFLFENRNGGQYFKRLNERALP